MDQRRESESFQFCRVVLPDHSSTILLCKEGQTLRQALIQLCDRRHLSFVALEVFLGSGDKVTVMTQCNVRLTCFSQCLSCIDWVLLWLYSINLLCVDCFSSSSARVSWKCAFNCHDCVADCYRIVTVLDKYWNSKETSCLDYASVAISYIESCVLALHVEGYDKKETVQITGCQINYD